MKKIICVVGPTASGKTKLGIELAKMLNTEIISADSVQVYKGLDIGSAKVTEKEMEGIKHHLIDICNPDQEYDMTMFQKEARAIIDRLTNEGKTPIIVGGTGLYINSLIFDYDTNAPKRDANFKEKYKELTNEQLHKVLESVDPEQAKLLHPNNRRRVERAIEIFETTGENKSKAIEKQIKTPLYDALIIALNPESREVLYENINNRVDKMVNQGLIDEVESVIKAYGSKLQSLNSIGYREVIDYIDGKIDQNEMTELIKKNTRNFAKRQITWFNNQINVEWVKTNYEDFQNTIEDAKKIVSKFLS